MKRFEISWRIFLHSLLVYVVFTLPALFLPFIFFVSLLIALLYGLIAVIIFWLCFNGLWHIGISTRTGYPLLFVSVIIAVTMAFQVFGWTIHLILPILFDPGENAWDNGLFLVFPLLAIIAGWIGIYRSRKRILKQFLTRPYAAHT
jgi:hypothetical protein